jgi:hypothetical protein
MQLRVRSIVGLVILLLVCFAGVQWVAPFEDDYWSVISDFIGSFHPLLLHLPIGLWFAVCALMAASVFVRDSVPRSIVYGLTVLTFASALLTFSAGFILYLGGGYGRATIELHMYSSLAFLVSLAIFLVSYGSANRPSFEWLSAGVTTAVLLIAGHAGGVITHGDPLDRAPWRIFAERANQELKSVDAVASGRVFDTLVIPILEDKCMACHGVERAKGKLKMNTYAALLKGGSKGACLLPGDSAGSLMIQRINLPLDDDKRMPPAEKEQLSLDEAAFLDWWVSAALPEEQLIESISFPSEQETYVQSIIGDDPVAIQARSAKARSKDLLLRYADFQTRYPGLLVQSVVGEALFELSSASLLGYDETSVRTALEPLADSLIRIDWNRRQLDAEWVKLFSTAAIVEVLNISDSSFSEADLLLLLSAMPELKKLNLTGTRFSDEQVDSIRSHSNIETIVLTGTDLSESGYRKLINHLPGAEIISDYSM